jgi:hypothetical protein
MMGQPKPILGLLISSLLTGVAWAQTQPSPKLWAGDNSSQSASARRAAIRKNGRFLGWKFAAQSGQDTRKWQRRVRNGFVADKAAVTQSGRRTPATSLPEEAFPIAGFGSHKALPAGYIPTGIVQGDFNEDGKMDFAVSNGGDNTIYVFLGNGDGTFQVPEILYTQGQSPNWITAVKLRKNGHLDLAVTDGDSNTVEVFLGNGDGTFQPSTQTSLPQIPTFILAADVNNDGNQDLVVGLVLDFGVIEPQVEVLLGDGSGGFSGSIFSAPVNMSLEEPVPTDWIAVGDLNNDGYVDLVTTVSGTNYASYLNQSGTGFSFVNFFGYGDDGPDVPLVVGLGDMDEDGCLDAVRLGEQDFVSVAKGSCDGNFEQNPSPAAIAGDFEPAIQVVDVNGDGHLDVVGSAVDYNEGEPGVGAEAGYLVSVLMGNGKGNLGVARTYRGGTDAYSLIVADFNGDNRPEILTADSLEDQVSLFMNDGSGNYGPPQGATIGYTTDPMNAPGTLTPVEVADLNGDGKPDLLLIEFGPGGGLPQLTSLLNDGTGKFLPPARTTITVGDGGAFAAFISGGFRNPAKPDVVYVVKYDGSNTVFPAAFFAGNGDGTFNPPVTLAILPDPQVVVAGDFNNDGKLDFVVMGNDSTGQMWEFDVFLGHGDGTFTQLPAQLFPMLGTDGPQQIFAIDLNHDGKLDLLIGLNANGGFEDSGDDLIEVLGNGDGTFQTPKTLIPHFGAVAVADVNHDGYMDLIQNRDPNGDFGQDGLFYQPGVTVYLGSADGTFQQQPSYDLPGVAQPSFNPALVGDFNGDGIPDIAVRYWAVSPLTWYLVEPRLAVLQGVGDGTFILTAHNYQLQAASYPLVGADFNGDGATDLMELTGLTSSFTTIPAAPGPTLDIALDSSPVLGTTGSATVSLNLPATTAETVTLSASDPAIQLPTTLTFSSGQQSQSFAFTLGTGYDATHLFALYAVLGAQTAVAYGGKPNPNVTVGVQTSLTILSANGSSSVTPGESLPVFLGLQSLGGYSATFSSYQCKGLPANTSCVFDSSPMLVLPGGPARVSFNVVTTSSTPMGTYAVRVTTTDGFVVGEATLTLGIGDFSLSINPQISSIGPSGQAAPTITSTATNHLNEVVTLTCNSLPAGARCGQATVPTNGSTVLTIYATGLVPQDYPFTIAGQSNIAAHSIGATLRVGDFTAALDKTAATLSAGQSATFNITLTSINHYTSSITVFCESPKNTVTCNTPPAVTLPDGGTASVQLTVSAAAVVGSSRPHPKLRSSGNVAVMAIFLPISFLVVLRKKRIARLLIGAALLWTIACGGGNNSGGGGGSGPNTVSVPVYAVAPTNPSDNDNQKTLGPIVVTLD